MGGSLCKLHINKRRSEYIVLRTIALHMNFDLLHEKQHKTFHKKLKGFWKPALDKIR